MLVVRHSRHWYEPRLPHLVFVDGMLAGVMRGDELRLDAPAGSYSLRVQFGGPIRIGKSGRSIDLSLSATQQIDIPRGTDITVTFHDRERLWNVLFDIDLVLWAVSLFATMPPLYKILSDAFFAVWLLRLAIIRKRYYKITVSDGLSPVGNHR